MMKSTNVQWPPSLWAAVTPSGPDLPELTGTQTADVIVVGAGFTGLSTALHLREGRRRRRHRRGDGAGLGRLGRNNGQVIPTLSRPDPDDIIARHGAAGERFVGLLRDSASTLFDVANRYQIAAEHEQTGWVQPVHSPGRIKIAERRVRQWSKFGAPVELLSRDQVRDMLDRTHGSAASGTGPAVISIRWRWHGGWCAPCSASAAASMRARRRKALSAATTVGW